jgi:1-phosphatidylinositol phosphodiesterase
MKLTLLENTSKWMETVPDNESLAHLSIPGTHDSCAMEGIASWPMDHYVDTQYEGKTIPIQLQEGIRYLDMRCYVVNNFIEIVHGDFDLLITLNKVLSQCISFLGLNTSETILMRIKQERSNVSDSKFIEVFNKII